MKVQASKERLLVLRLHPPALLRVRGYAINRLRVLLYGPGGSGKSTLAHAWLHYAERSEGTVRVDGKDVPFRFVPVGLLLESAARMHSYDECVEKGICPLVLPIQPEGGGNVQEAAIALTRKKIEAARSQAKASEILIPFVVVDSAAYLVQGSGQLADRWRGVSGFLDGLDALSPYSVLLMIAQERAPMHSPGPFPKSRPSVAESLMHNFHIKVRMTRTGAEAETFRLSVDRVSLAAQSWPSSPIEVTRASIAALIPPPGREREEPGQTKGKKGGGSQKAEPIIQVEFGGWVEVYVPQ